MIEHLIELGKELPVYVMKLANDLPKYGGDAEVSENLVKFVYFLAFGWLAYKSLHPIKNYIAKRRNV